MSDESQDGQSSQNLHIVHDMINTSEPLSNSHDFSMSSTNTTMSGTPSLIQMPPELQSLLGSSGDDDPWNKLDGSLLTSATSYQPPLSFTMPTLPPQSHVQHHQSLPTMPTLQSQPPSQPHLASQPLMPSPSQLQPHLPQASNIMARAPDIQKLVSNLPKAQLKDMYEQLKNGTITQEQLNNKLLSTIQFPMMNQRQQQTLHTQRQPQPQQQRPTITPQHTTFTAPMIGGHAIALPPTKSTTPAPSTPTTMTPASSSAPSGPSGDKIDYDTITDVMGYAGVDLREEAEFFAGHGDTSVGILPDGEDRSKLQDFMNSGLLKEMVLKLAKPLSVSKIDPDFLSYLALATQDRLRTLIEQMIDASKYRTRAQQFHAPPLNDRGYPMYKMVVQQDVRRQLLAIEHVDRARDRKRKRAMDVDMDESPTTASTLHTREDEATKGNHKGWVLKGKSTRDGETVTHRGSASGGGMLLPSSKSDDPREVTLRDAIFALERDGHIGHGNGQRTLLKMYNFWL